MQMDYLADGSHDCPLIRIFDFGAVEIVAMAVAFEGLAAGEFPEFILESASSVDSAHAIRLIFSLGSDDLGIKQLSGSQFKCECSSERYLDMAQLLQPFAESESSGKHQWLNKDSHISLLMTATENGHW